MKYYQAELLVVALGIILLCVYAKWLKIILALLLSFIIIIALLKKRKMRKGMSIMSKVNSQKVYDFLTKIPVGKVVTYGDIAEYLGNKNLAQTVGNILHNNPDKEKYPCYKVVRYNGKLAKNYAFGGAEKQKELLEKEHVNVENNHVDLNVYRWRFQND